MSSFEGNVDASSAQQAPLNIDVSTAKEANLRQRIAAPSSPTDQLLSPCSKLLNRKRVTSGVPREIFRPPSSTHTSSSSSSSSPSTLRIVLGSSSNNRRNFIRQLFQNVDLLNPDIDEKAIRSEDPYQLPMLIAKAKADALIGRNAISRESLPAVLITSDQIALYKDEIREKPVDRDEAKRFLNSYCNSSVSTVCAVVATHLPSMRQAADTSVSTVYFGDISSAEVGRIIDRGVVFTACGGFDIKDEDMSKHITELDGTEDCIMGMPLGLTKELVDKVSVQPASG